MFMKPEVSSHMQVLTRGPNGGNPTPTRQGRRCGAPHRPRGRQVVSQRASVRGRLVEAIGARPFRTRVKRRKAGVEGELAPSDEAPFPLVPRTYWRRDGLEVS